MLCKTLAGRDYSSNPWLGSIRGRERYLNEQLSVVLVLSVGRLIFHPRRLACLHYTESFAVYLHCLENSDSEWWLWTICPFAGSLPSYREFCDKRYRWFQFKRFTLHEAIWHASETQRTPVPVGRVPLFIWNRQQHDRKLLFLICSRSILICICDTNLLDRDRCSCCTSVHLVQRFLGKTFTLIG